MRFLLAAALFLTTPVLFGQAKRVDDAALKNAAKSASDGDWLSYGLTPGETRYSPLKQIDASNVKRLGLVWSYEVGDGGGDQEATPLEWNNTIFGVTNWSIVFAVDARTGKEKWRWDPEVNRKATGDKMCCGVVNRGLALYHNKIYVPVNDGRLEALDAETGKPVWETRVSYTQNEQTLTIAPRIAKGKVIVGTAGGDRPTRGFFAAYDADTGREVWKFYTVPGDPAKGFESAAMRKAAATWSGDWWKLGGGGAVWDGISYDPESELLYVGTGNAEPWPQALRTKDVSTGNDNLYVASIVAVNVEYGRAEVALPDGPWRRVGLRQRAADDPRGLEHQWQDAQGHHAGQQERLLLRARPHHGRVHLRPTLLASHLGEGDRSKDGTAHHQQRSEVRQGSRCRYRPEAAARTAGRRCPSIPRPVWCTFRAGVGTRSTMRRTTISNQTRRVSAVHRRPD